MFSRSENVVAGRGWVDGVVGGGGSLIVVARRRFCGIMAERVSNSVEVRMRLVGGRNAAISAVREMLWQ